MSYAQFKKESNADIVEAVKDIIETEKLNTPLIAHYRSHQRGYLMMYLREHTNLTLEDVGALFGGRHYTTVINTVNQTKDLESYKDHVYMRNTLNVRDYLKAKFNK